MTGVASTGRFTASFLACSRIFTSGNVEEMVSVEGRTKNVWKTWKHFLKFILGAIDNLKFIYLFLGFFYWRLSDEVKEQIKLFIGTYFFKLNYD